MGVCLSFCTHSFDFMEPLLQREKDKFNQINLLFAKYVHKSCESSPFMVYICVFEL